MKYTEFVKAIVNLGEDYLIGKYPCYGYYSIVYKDKTILKIDTRETFKLTSYNDLNDCPKKQEVWDIATYLAATPLDEREEKQKYNVIVGNDGTEKIPYLAWSRDDMGGYFVCVADSNDLREYSDYQFTESEYQDLLKYIKTLPQGDKQVEIAKIGKTLVED